MKSQIHKSLLSAWLVSICIVVIPEIATGIENFESLKVLDTVVPSYPLRMTYEGIYDGSARVIINVDETGKLYDVYLESYTHPEFGRLAEEYIKRWTFQPAKLNGEPITVVKPIDFNFDDRRGVYALGIQEAVASKLNFSRHAKSKRVYDHDELDNGLEPIVMIQPLYPEEFKDTDIVGNAIVLLYVDETGTPRMSHLTDYSHRSFGQTALMAIDTWRFKPPTVNGKPASIMVRQQFDFGKSKK